MKFPSQEKPQNSPSEVSTSRYRLGRLEGILDNGVSQQKSRYNQQFCGTYIMGLMTMGIYPTISQQFPSNGHFKSSQKKATSNDKALFRGWILWILWIWQKATPQGVEASKDWGFSSFAVPKVIQMAALRPGQIGPSSARFW